MSALAVAQGAEPVAEIRLRDTSRGKVNHRVLGKNVLGHVYVKGNMARNTNVSMQGSGLWDPRAHEPVEQMMRFLRETGTSVMRWPGGCGAHSFNWKKTVGPLPERPKQAFGLPEFLRCCEHVGAEPILTLADFWGTPEDFADIVEYLNAPVGKNPNGGKDWAAVRAAEGRREPYGVVWFECGNETYHGDHRDTVYTPGEYCERYRRIHRAMKAVDDRIKLGAVLKNGYLPGLTSWTREVIAGTAGIADFYIHHAYLPRYQAAKPSGSVKGARPAPDLYALAFAAARQFDMYYTALNRFIREKVGRRVPLAITELNGHFVQGEPVPYRLCLGTAVQVADLLQVLLEPRHNIDNAEYWQFSNEYWGLVRGYEPSYQNPGYWKFSKSFWGLGPYRPPYLKLPAYHVYKLYHDYLGDTLIDVDVTCDGYDTNGGLGVLPAHGSPSEFEAVNEPVRLDRPNWQITNVAGARAVLRDDGTLSVDITSSSPLNYYHAAIALPAKPNRHYKVTAEIRTDGIPGKRGAAIEVQDGRGFGVTRSFARSREVREDGWTGVQCQYTSLPDATGIKVIARRLGPHLRSAKTQAPCRFWVRNLAIQECLPWNSGRVPYLAALATRRADQSVSVIIVNRNLTASVPVRVTGIAAGRVRAETLSGPRVDAMNEENPNTCVLRPLPVQREPDGIRLDVPPHSVSAVELGR